MDRQPIFLTEKDRVRFLHELRAAFERHGTSLLSFCLMSNHLHLLVRAGDIPISVPLQEALGRYSSYFNFVHGRVGHLFQGRYHAVLCKSERQLVETVLYVHMNPVEAKLAARPEEWPWSSHRELVSGEHRWIDLGALAESTGLSAAELRGLYLKRLSSPKTSVHRGAIEDLLAEIAGRSGIELDDLRAGRRGGAFTRARCVFLKRARESGYSDAEITRTLGCSKAAVSMLSEKVKKGLTPP